MSDTPRTDAWWKDYCANESPWGTPGARDFARTLELELAEATTAIASLMTQDSEATQRIAERLAKANKELSAAQARIAELESNNARLLDACRAALSLLEDPDGDEFKANAVADQLQKAITK